MEQIGKSKCTVQKKCWISISERWAVPAVTSLKRALPHQSVAYMHNQPSGWNRKYYDMGRLPFPAKGIYIMNGKKVIVK